MNNSSPTPASASSLPAGKITRKQLAAYCGLCVRSIDELTRTGVLGHYKIGKSVRYDLAEVEATLRARFHVQPAAQEPLTHTEEVRPLESLQPAAFSAAATAPTTLPHA